MSRRIAIALSVLALAAPASAQEVRSYASQINDVDAVNSHWIIGENGVVLIDAQRILPEADRALEHLRLTTDLPVVAIFITHAHTDHYGGLPVWLEAYPEARLYLDRTTYNAISGDEQGFNAARRERHGERFATQAAFDMAIAEAVIVQDGQEMVIDGLRLRTHFLGPSEARSTVLVSLPDEKMVFIGDLVNVGVPAVPFESAAAWLTQLDRIEADYPGYAIYQGHGPAPIGIENIPDQRHFLRRLIELTQARMTDGAVSETERDEIVLTLEAEWPFLAGVAGNTRRQMLAFDVDLVTSQLREEDGDNESDP